MIHSSSKPKEKKNKEQADDTFLYFKYLLSMQQHVSVICRKEKKIKRLKANLKRISAFAAKSLKHNLSMQTSHSTWCCIYKICSSQPLLTLGWLLF